MEITQLIIALVTVLGAGCTSYLGVQVALGRHDERLKVAEREINDLRKWKHLDAVPYINDIKNLNIRLERIERILERKAYRDAH